MALYTDKSEDLDRRRSELEQNVEKLRKVVRHWQTWEAEYEGFKEEIQSLKPDAQAKDIQAVADDFGGDILTSKECRDILLSSTGTPRTVTQITNILNVQENVKTAQRQLSSAESKINAFNSVLEVQPRDEDGLPLQEITEMLDEDDNVISSNVVDTTSVAPEILDNLRKSGVKGIPRNDDNEAKSHSSNTPSGSAKVRSLASSTETLPTTNQGGSAAPLNEQKIQSTSSSGTGPQTTTKPQNDIAMEDANEAKPSTVHEDVLRSLNGEFPDNPTVPMDETPEESALRREMLEYNMNEVGAVVATMDFDQNAQDNDDDFDDDDDYEEGSYEDESDEPEDEYGRTTTRVIDDNYRREMKELEARLNARAMVNVGQTMPQNPKVEQDEKSVLEESPRPRSKPSGTKQKGVRFAESLDIAEPPTALPTKEPSERPVAETVIERSSSRPSNIAPTASKKVSRFSAARSGPGSSTASHTTSQKNSSITSGPLAGMNSSMLAPVSRNGTKAISTGQSSSENVASKPILADKLVERSPNATEVTAPSEPDEFDPAIVHKQVTKEYHRLRDKFHQDGVLVDREVSDDDEADAESGTKVSRFKAAKLSRK